MNNFFTVPLFIPGTLTANVAVVVTMPCQCQLVEVSAKADANTSFILDIGSTADEDAYLDGKTVTGHATDPVVFNRDDFVNEQFPAMSKGAQTKISVDYDGGAGTDGANVNVLLTFAH